MIYVENYPALYMDNVGLIVDNIWINNKCLFVMYNIWRYDIMVWVTWYVWKPYVIRVCFISLFLQRNSIALHCIRYHTQCCLSFIMLFIIHTVYYYIVLVTIIIIIGTIYRYLVCSNGLFCKGWGYFTNFKVKDSRFAPVALP